MTGQQQRGIAEKSISESTSGSATANQNTANKDAATSPSHNRQRSHSNGGNVGKFHQFSRTEAAHSNADYNPGLSITFSRFPHPPPRQTSSKSINSIASSIRSFTLRRENAAVSSTDLNLPYRTMSNDNMDDFSMPMTNYYPPNKLEDFELYDISALSTFMNMLDYETWMAQHLLQRTEEEIDSYLGNLHSRIAFGFKVVQVQAVLIILNAFYTVMFIDNNQDNGPSLHGKKEEGSLAFGALLLLVIVALVTRFLEFFSGISSIANTGKLGLMSSLSQKPSFKTVFKQLLRAHYHHLVTLHVLILVCVSVQYYNDWYLFSILGYMIVWKVCGYYLLKYRCGSDYDKPLTQVQRLQTDLCQRVSFYFELIIGLDNHTTTTLYMVEYVAFAWIKYFLVPRQTLFIQVGSTLSFALNVQILYPIYALCDYFIIATDVRLNMWKILELFDACDPFARLEKPWTEYTFGGFVDLGVFHKESAIYREFMQIRDVYRALYAHTLAASTGDDQGLEKSRTDMTTLTSSNDIKGGNSVESKGNNGLVDRGSRNMSKQHDENGVGSTAIIAIQV